jgi:hypothetical protein
MPQVLSVLPHIPWLSGTLAFLHWSLWTGNWSFLSFSKATLNLELTLVGIALVLYFVRRPQFTPAERWTLFACASFIVGLVYQTCATYIHTGGASLFAEPWYWQGIVCLLWLLAFRGLQCSECLGRSTAVMTVCFCAWIAIVTYVGKLFPLYGGGFSRATISRVWSWWMGHPTRDLSVVALAPPLALYTLLTGFLLILAFQTALIIRALIRSPNAH